MCWGFGIIRDSSWVEYEVSSLYDCADPSRMTAFAALGVSVSR